MKVTRNCVASFGLAAALVVPAGATTLSDPMGVYCRVDRVVLEPAATPERAQVWGVCAVANQNDWNFQPPAAGYFYYAVPSVRPDVARAEWQDLKSVAGTGEVVGFGRRYQPLGRFRASTEKPDSPDIYPLHLGVLKVGSRRVAPEVTDIVTRIRAVRGQ